MDLNAYVHLNGRCAEALEFYRATLGGTTDVQTFADSPMGDRVPADWKSKIVHAVLRFPGGELMASDGMPGAAAIAQSNVSLAIHADTPSDAERIFAALSAGGTVTMPLQETYWAARFGMFTDRFGIEWMVNAPAS